MQEARSSSGIDPSAGPTIMPTASASATRATRSFPSTKGWFLATPKA